MTEEEKWCEGIDPEESKPADMAAYIRHCISKWMDWKVCDSDLWGAFRDDFEGWDMTHFKKIKNNIRPLRDYLRSHGVWAQDNEKITISQSLADVLQKESPTQWTEWEIKKGLQRDGFNSRDIDYLIKTDFGRRDALAPSYIPPTQTQPPVPAPFLAPPSQPSLQPPARPAPQLSTRQATSLPDHPSRQIFEAEIKSADDFQPLMAAQSYGRQLANLTKMYTDESRYSGEEDNFDFKLTMFRDLCDRADVPNDAMAKAFPTMLRGLALDYYYSNLSASKHLPFDDVCNAVRDYFEGAEYRRSTLTKWNSLTLKSVMEKNKDKSMEECLQLLLKDLRHLQHGLDSGLRDERFIHNKLLNACRELPACQYACFKPADTMAGLINDLRSSIVTYKESHPEDSQAFFTDRRYYKQQHSRPSLSLNSRLLSNSRPSSNVRPPPNTRPQSGYQSRQNKSCFVCQKGGCWSSRHTQEEREEAKRRYKDQMAKRFDNRSDQYIADIEGHESEHDDDTDKDNDLEESMEALILDTEPQSPMPESSTTFFTSFNAEAMTTSLANQSLDHAITGTTPKSCTNDDVDIFTYISTTCSERYSSRQFYGVMIDTGASKYSTAGYGQYQACRNNRHNVFLDNSKAGVVNAVFGIGSTSSIGSFILKTPVGNIEFHVVYADTPLLLCLADMDKLGIYYNNIENVLVTTSPTRNVPVVRRFGHPFLLWEETLHNFITTSFYTNPCYLTDTELRQLHRRFGHPSASRLHNVLERSGHDDVNKKAIDRLTKLCTQCQMHGKAPARFRFTLRDDVAFNYSIIVDIMYIDGSPLLHIVDEATRFQAARWLTNLSAKHTWDALRLCWIDVYTGPPDHVIHDAGTNFVSKEFRQYAATMGIITKAVPVEAHWSIGMVERYHAVLRRAYKIMMQELGTDTSKTIILQMAVKAVNDTAGPNGLVPTLLVFGAFPRMTEYDPPSPTVAQRSAAAAKAMKEVQRYRAERQVADALNQRNGPVVSVLHDLPLNANVLVWREGPVGRSGKWSGPFKMLGIEGETCKVELPNGVTDFRTTTVKPFLTEELQENEKDHPETISATTISTTPTENTASKWNLPPPMMTRQRAKHPELSIMLQEDNISSLFADSRRKEINGLLEKGVFQVVNIIDVPYGIRIFNSRFVDELKNAGTDKAFEKSRLVVQAYNDAGKHIVLTQSPTIQRVSQRIILAMTAMMNLGLYLRDISQAYVQSTTQLNRDFFVRPPPELSLGKDAILKVIKPLYGIPEAGNHWFNTYHRHHTEKLAMVQSTFDPCLLFTNTNGFGIVGLQTDDTLFLADDTFARAEQDKLQEAKLLAKERERLSTTTTLKFNGGLIAMDDAGITLSQERQCQNINLVSTKPTELKSSRRETRKGVSPKDQYIAQRARGAYVASVCQPEAAFDLSFAAQVICPEENDVKALNKRLQWQLDNSTRGLRFVHLDAATLKLVVFTDASFANNKDLSSQIGYVIALVDGNNKANVLHWSSIKCKRVTRSVLASELYAMAHGFDMGAAIKSTIEKVLQQSLPMIICTDSKSLYDCLVKLGTTQEKRLMVDLMCLRQSYERREIAEIKWIDGGSNPADAMTKGKPCQALKDLIDTNMIKLTVTEWVERMG